MVFAYFKSAIMLLWSYRLNGLFSSNSFSYFFAANFFVAGVTFASIVLAAGSFFNYGGAFGYNSFSCVSCFSVSFFSFVATREK